MQQYIVDTNYFINNLQEVISFVEKNQKLILLSNVFEELDKLKNKDIQDKKQLREQTNYIHDNYEKFEYVETNTETYADPQILEYQLKTEQTVLTNDINLQTLCKFKGIEYISGNNIDPFFQNPVFEAKDTTFDKLDLYPNQYVKFDENNTTMYYINDPEIGLDVIKPKNISIKTFKKKIQPINIEQKLFIDQFNREHIELITISGVQGSGKTFISLAAQLEQLEKGKYEKLFFSAPAVQIGGKDKYGYVPGSLEEKVSIYAGGFLDNLAFLSSTDRIDKNNIVFDKIHIEILPLNLLRGRSLKNTIIILDESQNATLDELQAILTRQDKGTKLIFMGDVLQTDSSHKFLNNDFVKVITAFKNSKYQTHINFPECLRNNIAREAVNLYNMI